MGYLQPIDGNINAMEYASIYYAFNLRIQQWWGAEMMKSCSGPDTILPFGLRSAPKVFAALADELQWILMENIMGTSLTFFYLLAPLNLSSASAYLTGIQLANCNSSHDRHQKLENSHKEQFIVTYAQGLPHYVNVT